ncbi:MAG: flagellin FliC [Vampirovibrionales bacterium]|nr:flagellin FliC [Vampirovibrionales bacterium]
MALVINTNVTSLIAHRRLSMNASNVQKSLERLASGMRINRSSDDAAGLTISETLIGQIRGNQKALQNAQDGVSILQIAEGSLGVINNNLQRMRELAVQAANDTNSQSQRDSIAREVRTLAEDIERISQATEFNGIHLLDGSALNARLQIGPGTTLATNTIDISSALQNAGIDSNSVPPGIGVINSAAALFASLNDIFDPVAGTSPDLSSGANARTFIGSIQSAIDSVTSRMSIIGSLQNQLQSAIDNLQIGIENFSASNSRIRDLDIASESSTLVQNQILQQSAVSVLSQANSIPQLTLQLLQK